MDKFSVVCDASTHGAEFKIMMDGFLLATFTIDEPELFEAADYEDFIAHRRIEMTFLSMPSKYICLSWQNAKIIQFEVSILGQRNGSIVLHIPGDATLPALQKLAACFK